MLPAPNCVQRHSSSCAVHIIVRCFLRLPRTVLAGIGETTETFGRTLPAAYCSGQGWQGARGRSHV
jgi:hypothetical protein